MRSRRWRGDPRFETYVDDILSVPWRRESLCVAEQVEPGPAARERDDGRGCGGRDVVMSVVRRRANLIAGLRRVGESKADVAGDDNVEMNEIRVADGDGKGDGRRVCTIGVDAAVYDAVCSEDVVFVTRDDVFLDVRRRMHGLESKREFLFRRCCDAVLRDKGVAVGEYLGLMGREFCGLVVVSGRPMTVARPGSRVTVGMRSREGIGEGEVRGMFAVELDGLCGSGTGTQDVEAVYGYRRSRLEIRFDYHKVHMGMSGEELMGYYLDNRNVPLGSLFDEIVCVSQPGMLRTNCLMFVELKTGLFFGGAETSAYDVGRSLLFFVRMFGGAGVAAVTNKVIEYVEHAVRELDVCRGASEGLLFLHETCLFINMMIARERQRGCEKDGEKMRNELLGLGDDPEWYGDDAAWPARSRFSSYHKAGGSSRIEVVELRRTEVSEKRRRGDAVPVTQNRIGDVLLEGLTGLESEGTDGMSGGAGKLMAIHRRLREVERRGLAGAVPGKRVGSLIVSILEENTVREGETVLLCTVIKEISHIVPVQVSILDKALVVCIGKVVCLFRRRLRRLMKDGREEVESVFEAARRFYTRLRYLGSGIHLEIFKSDLCHAIEEESVEGLRSAPSEIKAGLSRLGICRKMHEEHLFLLQEMGQEIELGYCLEEKRAFMRLYDVQRIRGMLREQGSLEREVLKMIGQGAVADEGIRNRYKLYLYECIRETARGLFGDEDDKTMMCVNKCFI